MPFAAALSEHPDPAHAVGECVGRLLDAHGPHPDLLVLFATAGHRAAWRDVVGVARRLLQPACLAGALTTGVVGGGREVEDRPALSLWAAWGLGPVRGVHLRPAAGRPGSDPLVDALDRAGTDRSVLLFADPSGSGIDDLLERIATERPGTAVVGGQCGAGVRPDDTVLLLDDMAHPAGAVAVVVPVGVGTVVSQGCRPVGEPFTVTRADGNVLEELGSRPALTRLQELALTLDRDDRESLTRGVHLGRVTDEHRAEHGRGDFLVRGVLGTRTTTGALVIGDRVEVGDTVQFQLRDAASAHEDLVELLAGRRADGALVFTCNGRGTALFGDADHDASTVSELTGTDAVAGCFCAGEIGPVGSRSFLHGYTASVALFTDRSTRS